VFAEVWAGFLNSHTFCNRQAGHGSQMGNTRYGQFVSVTDMSFLEMDGCFGVSQVIQAFLQVNDLDERWSEICVDLAWRVTAENRKIAADHSRMLVSQHYGLPGLAHETSGLVKSLLSELPFLGMFRVPDGAIRDKVLVGVTAALLYGHGQPRGQGALVIGGLDVALVADAVVQVSLFFSFHLW
jgi:hypothetical protein